MAPEILGFSRKKAPFFLGDLPEYGYRKELDLETLVWTRGRAFPLSRLEARLGCPRCGSRDIVFVRGAWER